MTKAHPLHKYPILPRMYAIISRGVNMNEVGGHSYENDPKRWDDLEASTYRTFNTLCSDLLTLTNDPAGVADIRRKFDELPDNFHKVWIVLKLYRYAVETHTLQAKRHYDAGYGRGRG